MCFCLLEKKCLNKKLIVTNSYKLAYTDKQQR